MCLHMDKEAGDEFLHADSIRQVNIVKRGQSPLQVEIWDEDCEHCFGKLPAELSVPQLNVCIRAMYKCYADGQQVGMKLAKANIRSALGIES